MIGFEWNENKNLENQEKHGVSFEDAQKVFQDPHILIAEDVDHSTREKRQFAIGEIELHRNGIIYSAVVTVRFTYRGKNIRIIGAGTWRKQRRLYYEHKT